MTSRALVRAPARIRVDSPRMAESTWCWREDWVSGGESIYCLLALFEALNVVHARQVADAFIEPVPTRDHKRVVRNPTVDLRSPERFRLARFALATRLDIGAIGQGFVTEAFPASGWRGDTSLRWCPKCANAAFHSTMFQLSIVHACPAHGDPLLSSCPRCRSRVPYSLRAGSAAPMFCCPQCGLDLAPQLREGLHRVKLAATQAHALRERFLLMQFCDRMPMIAAKLLNGGRSAKTIDLVTSTPGRDTVAAEFTAFATRVMMSLRASCQMDWQSLEPACSFAEPRAARVGRAESVKRAATGWPEHLVPRTDRNLIRAAEVYRCVRRHLWRTAVYAHRRCAWSAAERLWWPVIGSTTTSFCPIAAAYLRWRMVWEGVSTLPALRTSPKSAPLGLVTWLAAGAPVGPATWTSAVSSWLLSEVLGRDLFASFEELLVEECRRGAAGEITWEREATHRMARSCWVCAGRGTSASPARLFVLSRQSASADHPAGRSHYARHLASLKRIEH